MTAERRIKPIAMPGIHDRFYIYLKSILKKMNDPYLIDLGAGHGYLVKKLFEEGFRIEAADLFPEYYLYDKVACKKVDITKDLPYGDGSFDLILAVELMEHVHDHEVFFKEAYRILKPNGMLIFTTPNILSLKSRVRFLFSGFFYSFNPLNHDVDDGLQHVASLTVDQYTNLARRSRFREIDISVDKRQRTSRVLLFMIPLLKLYCYLRRTDYSVHNRLDYLTGRILFVCLQK